MGSGLCDSIHNVEVTKYILSTLHIPIILLPEPGQDASAIKAKDNTEINTPTSDQKLVAALEGALYNHSLNKTTSEKMENLYRIMVEVGNEGISRIDKNQVITFVNDRWCTALGYTPEEVLGRHITDFMFPEAIPDHLRIVCERMEGKASRYERRLKRKDGSTAYMIVSSFPMLDDDGTFSGSFGMLTDISELKKTEDALRESEERYRRIVSAITGYIFTVTIKDGKAVQTLHSQACIGVTGHTADEFTNDQNLWISMVHVDDRDAVRRQIADILNGGIFKPAEHRIIRKDGHIRWIRNTPVPHYDIKGELISYDGIIQDITDARMAEEKYQTIFEQAVEAIYQTTPDGKFLNVNKALARVLGYDSSEEIMNSVTDIETQIYVDPIQCQEVRVALNEKGILTNYETQYRCKDGTAIWISLNARTVRQGDGAPLYYQGSFVDITEKKNAIDALRVSEDRYRILFETSPDPIVIYDLKGNIIDVNRLTATIYGLGTEHEFLSTFENINQIMDHTGLAKVKRTIKSLLSNKKVPKNEHTFLTLDGQTIQMEVSTSLIYDKDKRPVSVISILHDITGRKEAEMQLRESEEKYHRIFDNSPVGIFYFNTEGVITDCNDVLINSLRTSRQALLGLHISALSNEGVVTAFENALRGEICIFEGEYYPLSAFDSLYVKIHFTPIMLDDGQIVGGIGIAEDLTESKRVEKERAHLEKRIQQSQHLEALGTLAGGIAHDFNNILSAIIGFSELSMDDVDKGSVLHSNIREILKAGERARELVSQILTFSRQDETERKPVKISLILKEALKMLRASIPRTVSITQHIDPDTGMILGDPTKIHQVIMNLCTNAYHAMIPEGGDLQISLENIHLDEPFSSLHPPLKSGPHLKLTVKDTGCGMDQHTMNHIFDPFFTTKEKGKGTGLGLAIVHGIIADIEGVIVVNSELNKGSSFEIYLPVVDRATEEFEVVESVIQPDQGVSILLVDDEETILDFTATMLKKCGYSVTTISSPVQALDLVRSDIESFSLIITDQTMPGMTGIKLATEVLKHRPSMPIILMSGFHENITPELLGTVGIKKYMAKPFTKKILIDTISHCLQ